MHPLAAVPEVIRALFIAASLSMRLEQHRPNFWFLPVAVPVRLTPGANAIPHAVDPEGRGIAGEGHGPTRDTGVTAGAAAHANTFKGTDGVTLVAQHARGGQAVGFGLEVQLEAMDTE